MSAERTDKKARSSADEDEGSRERDRRSRRMTIGAELRRAYTAILNEPVPESFRQLFGGRSDPRGGKKP